MRKDRMINDDQKDNPYRRSDMIVAASLLRENCGGAKVMMMIGAIGTGIAPPQYFGIVERCSVFAATGFNAVLGWYLFGGFER